MCIISGHHLLLALLFGNDLTEMLLLLFAGVAIFYAVKLKVKIDKQNKILNEHRVINERQDEKIKMLSHLLMSIGKKETVTSNKDLQNTLLFKQEISQTEKTGMNAHQQLLSATVIHDTLKPNIIQDEIFLEKLLQQLELVYTDASFNVEKLSEKMYISRSQLYRKVKEMSGLSPVEFLRDYRLQKAMMLLDDAFKRRQIQHKRDNLSSWLLFSNLFFKMFQTRFWHINFYIQTITNVVKLAL